jgi:hypothetical protein
VLHPRQLARRCLVLALATTLLAACARRPDFDLDKAHVEMARAFGKTPPQVALYSDGRGDVPDEWIVEFRIDGFRPFMQAKFKGRKDRWELAEVRERPDGPEEAPWESVGRLVGTLQGENAERAHATEVLLQDLAELIERQAAQTGGKFPTGDIGSLKRLLVGDGGLAEKDWHFDVDAWGQPILYHAAPDGVSYVLVSSGADGTLDIPKASYETNADNGLERYAGATNDINKDIVLASGTLVQRYAP